jgi:hypothetical protein
MKRSLKTQLSLFAVLTINAFLLSTSPLHGQAADLYVNSTPQGAEVSVDGKTEGVTPLTLPAVAPGRHLVTVSLRGYRTIYETIETSGGAREVLDLTLTPLHGLVLIHSIPSGADVEINDVHRGKTPVLVADLPYGIHRAQLTKSGFLPRQLDISVNDRTPQQLNATLSSDTATVAIRTDPSGATVTLDGVSEGTSPCTLEGVRTGNMKLGITAAGHHPFEETLLLKAGETRELDITLRPRPSSLQVTTTPPGARILINDQYRGRSPVTVSPLAAGTYTLRAELTAHDPIQRNVQIALGQSRVEELTLIPNAGRMEITTEPAGAKVLIDGMPSGVTKAAESGTDKISQLFTLSLIPVGTHELTFTKPGYYPLSQEITVIRNETLTGHFTLTRRFIPNCQVQTKTDVYRGVLIERNPTTLKLELRPGIFKTLRLDDVTSITPLRSAPDVPETDGEN